MPYAYYECPWGYWKIGYEKETVTLLQVVGYTEEGQRSSFSDRVYRELCEYLEGRRKEFDLDFALNGTPFQKEIWRQCLTIPYGTTLCYKELAMRAGRPKAARAAGSALDHNPVWILVPCHRVVPRNGGTGGYAGGERMKKELLELEARHKEEI